MPARSLRIVLLLGVILGIVAPKSSVALAELGLIDATNIVICTGHGLKTITIGPDGTPAKLPTETLSCALVHAADTAARSAWAGRRNVRAPAHVVAVPPALPAGRTFSMWLARAPPAV